MKKKGFLIASIIFVIMLFMVLSCTKKDNPTLPSDTYTPTKTPTAVPPDNSIYSFEAGTTMSWVPHLGGVTLTSNTTDMAYLGTHALRLDGNFTGGASNSAVVQPPVITDMTGMIVRARVYIPAGKSAGGAIYIQSGSGMAWEQGAWTSFTGGGWTTLTLNVDAPDGTASGANHADIKNLGINFNPSTSFTGSVYFDSIEIISAGTPTGTPTATPTHSISPTATETITGTPPTGTVTPTITITHTPVSTPIAPSDPSIQYYGRWNTSNPAVAKNGWGATYIVSSFSGTSISINLKANYDSWYAYAIDDFSDHKNFIKFRVRNGWDQSQAIPTQTPLVVTGLADTTHTIMVVRRTEGWGGVDSFLGFGLDTNKTLSAAPARPTRKMEFIGDSITVGASNEYNWSVPTPTADLPCNYGACISNGDMAFGPQVARMFNAEGRVIGRGGIGMAKNCSGCDPQITIAPVYPNMYFETAPSGSSLTWNFADWQAQIVVIALGTNDNSAGASQTEFQNAYSAFIDTLRGYYPNAYILCTEPIPTWVGTTTGTYISNVVAAKSSDTRIKYVPLRNPAAAGFPLVNTEFANDTTHPMVDAHTKAAQAIYDYITNDAAMITDLTTNLGW
ncbi:MAG: GDSL-type esterase/lipase family protein [Spirochaetia bacterium]|nr:GDSL-type esterase/lipase family protein [Spirochaetia bacterium]